jgi:hypothetical protein
MTGRERIEAALDEGTPEIPMVISCYEEIYQDDHWNALTSCPWWYKEAPEIDRMMAWRREALANTPQDWFRLPFCKPRRERENLRIDARGEEVFRIHRRTGQKERLRRTPIGGWPCNDFQSPDEPPDTQEAVDKAIPIPEGFSPNRVHEEGRNELASRLLEEFGERLFPNHRTESPLTSCARLWGFEGMMVRIATRPDLVAHACKRYLLKVIRRVREAATLGVAGMWIVDGLSDMISPEHFSRLGLPHIVRIVEEVRACGMASIYYFTGDPAGKWDLILSTGADALAFEESKKGFEIDIEEVAERVCGRNALFGNLDSISVLERGTNESLREEIRRQLRAGRSNGRRFILSTGSPVTPATTVERVRLYCDLARELGRR